MPKYLLQASYMTEGLKGLLKEGGSKRRAAAEETIKGLGGKLEAFYFAFGESDAVVIVDVPDNVSATAAALVVNASGAVAGEDDGPCDSGRGGPGDEEGRPLPGARTEVVNSAVGVA